jgi:signal transduction histidine kinase/ActR/RegA family two-component response regulator
MGLSLPRRTLRRTLFFSGLLILTTAVAVMLGAVSLAMSQRDAIERDSDAFMDEQRIADQIVAFNYEQQLAAYRFLQRPDTLYLVAFRTRGEQAYREMRGYLFHELSVDARLQVESIKEAQQQFEVAAERAFDLARNGEPEAAQRRLAGMDERAAAFDSAVRQFLLARSLQRDVFRREHEQLARRFQIALMIAVLALFLLVILLVGVLRRRVIVPLDHLVTAARRLGEGDTTARVPSQLFAEFDDVATGFNQMADRVQASRDKDVAQNQELRNAMEHLRATQEELVQHEKLSAMGQMLAGLAHELNNPLAGVLGMSEILRDELAASRDDGARRLARDLAAPLASEAARARDLVRSLLSFARKSGGTLGPVPLFATTKLAIGLRSAAFASAGKKLVLDIAPTLYVEAETQKLQHVIVNIVNNALDAMTSDHGTSLRISASVVASGSVHLVFDDDGPGFADLRAAFEPFYTTKPAERGTGLGLTIAQKFVHEFGGSLFAENRVSGGARITIVLRRATAATKGESEMPTPDPESPSSNVEAVAEGATGPSAASTGAARRRILVVDDEPSLRQIQRRLLQHENVDVLLAADGEEAREILAVEMVDLVISDLRMPGATDGRGLIAWIAEHQPHLSQRILIVTGDLNGLSTDSATDVPPERVLSKPFTRQEYVSRVRAALERDP